MPEPEAVPVPDAEAAPPPALVRPEAGYVAVTKGDKVQLLPEENIQAASAAGYRPASQAEYEAQRDGVMGDVRAAVYGAARGASFGAFDPLAVEASRAVYGEEGAELARKELSLSREGHGGITLGGEVAGSLAPLFFGNPEAIVAKGEGLLARAGSRVAQAAPRLLAEGAAIGAGQQLTEDTLGNHDVVAQKYLASALKGGVLNVVLGGGLVAGAGAIGDRLALRGGRVAETALVRETGGPYRALGTRAEGAAATVAEREGGVLARAAEEQAFKGIGAKIRDWQKLGATAERAEERAQRIGRTLLDEGISTPGATLGTQAKRLTARVAEVGEELGTLRKTLERASVRPSAEAVLRRIDAEVVQPLAATPFSRAEQHAVAGYVDEIAQRYGDKASFGSFEELHKLRRALDTKLDPKLWSKVPGSAPAAAEELGKIRRILEEEFEGAAEKAAAELGEDVASSYRVKKALFSDLKTAEKIAVKETARAGSNRAISLTDTIAGAVGIASMGPQGLALAAANKAVRTFGNQVAAAALNRASKIERIARAAETFDTRLKRSVASFFGKGTPPPAVARKTAERASPETLRALRDAVKNPAQLTERFSQALAKEGFADEAPRVSQAMTTTFARAASYLASRLPPEPPPRGLTFGPQRPRPMGLRAQTDTDRVLRALDAETVLDDIARGRIDRQGIEALRIINPELHQEIAGELTRYGIENRPELSHQQAVALSIITGQPISPVMRPETIRGFQQAYIADPTQDPTTQGPQPQPIGSGGASMVDALKSGSDRAEAGDVP